MCIQIFTGLLPYSHNLKNGELYLIRAIAAKLIRSYEKTEEFVDKKNQENYRAKNVICDLFQIVFFA